MSVQSKREGQNQKEFLVFRGSCPPEGIIRIEPADLMQVSKSPYYGDLVFKDIKFVGKAKDGSILFIRHPYELIRTDRSPKEVVARPFALAVEALPNLESVEISYKDKLVHVLDRSKKASIELKTEIDPEGGGVALTIKGTYSCLSITARDPESGYWTHVYLDTDPTGLTKKTIKIPWDRFPIAKRAVIEAVAIRGIDVAKSRTEEINVKIQEPRIHIYPVGFREVEAEDGPEYQFVFAAKTELHGQSLPDAAYQWHVPGKTQKGRRILISQKGKGKFTVKVVVTDKMGREFSSEMNVDPIEWSKKYKERIPE